MGGKKKKGSKKKKSTEEGEEGEANEPAPPPPGDPMVIIEFRLLNWKYMNFSQRFKDSTYVFTIKKLLTERHGRIEDLRVCVNSFTEQTEIKDEMLMLRDAGLKGRSPNMILGESGVYEIEEGSIPTFQIFYDFRPVSYSDPILLHK